MKFITEDDLRELYKTAPFTEYVIEPGTRITPGARQFLADRGINMFDGDSSWKPNAEKPKSGDSKAEQKKDLCSKRLCLKMKSMEAMFLAIAQELLERDVLLAQKVIHLKKSFSDICSILEGKNSTEELCCQECTGIKECNFSENMEDCFEITDFHIQLGKGKEIILLHRLRCALRELEMELSESLDCNEEEDQNSGVVRVNQIINTLSQLICVTAGGEKCQRQI